MENYIEISNLSRTFITGGSLKVHALKDINLSVQENDFISIVGPSGCGKSTLLRIISSLEKATKGNVFFKGKEITKPSFEIGMVFQHYSLLQWKNVINNIALGAEFKKVPKKQRLEEARKYLKLINMEEFENAAKSCNSKSPR